MIDAPHRQHRQWLFGHGGTSLSKLWKGGRCPQALWSPYVRLRSLLFVDDDRREGNRVLGPQVGFGQLPNLVVAR
ncbi:protein of unknown function [Bradyrhizobium vignae]|uniref:Uncharacterized protein n=1 Tax=Bradyrhizobium vignae TaxID=1549949 RepID=A0A2U3PU83_9BRAD|nr:protein of unknown function [Bradyrhizobium vignae]